MFDNSKPTTFAGKLGFSFGPTLLGQNVGTLDFPDQGQANNWRLRSNSNCALFLCVGFCRDLLSDFKSMFPIVSSTGIIIANFNQ